MRSVSEASADTRRYSTTVIAACVALVGWLAYWNTTPADFVWDDVSSVLIHRHVQDPVHFVQLFREDQHAFGRGQGNFYRPLLAATFMADFWVTTGGQAPGLVKGVPDVSPFVFHVSSILWHIAAALALLAFLSRAGAPPVVQAATVLLYVVHPLHTEAVAYISGRADSMAAAFVFLGLYFGLAPGPRIRIVVGALASVACFALAVLSKESGAILPVLLAVAALSRIWVVREPLTGLDKALVFLPALLTGVGLGVYAWLRTTVLRFADAEAEAAAPLLQRLAEAGQALALYIKLLFWPTNLHMERTLDGVPLALGGVGALAVAVLLGLVYVGVRQRRPALVLGLGLFLVTWFPISGVIPLNAPMAEHWLYVPMAGFWWALSDSLWRITGPLKLRPAFAVPCFFLGAVFFAFTIERNRDWRDNVTLFEATLAQNPDSLRVHFNLAVAHELNENWPGARRHYQTVLDMYQRQRYALANDRLFWTEELEAHLSLGDMALRRGEIDAAQSHFAAVLRRAQSAEFIEYAAHGSLGMARALASAGNPLEAERVAAPWVRHFPELKGEVEEILRGRTLSYRF